MKIITRMSFIVIEMLNKKDRDALTDRNNVSTEIVIKINLSLLSAAREQDVYSWIF